MLQLELQSDIYCYTFFKFMDGYNPSVQKDLIIKCMCTFFFQIGLVYLIIQSSGGMDDVY